MLRCPKCKKEFPYLRAMSRYGEYYVCDLCGNKEALEIAVQAGQLSKTEKRNIERQLEYSYQSRR